MVFTRPHALLAAASILNIASASVAAPPAGEVVITKTITNTHTVCPATTKPPVCSTTGIVPGGGHGSGSGPVGGGGWGSHKPQDEKEDADLWQSWLDRMSSEAAQISKSQAQDFTRPPWLDWNSKPTTTPSGDHSEPTGGHGTSTTSGSGPNPTNPGGFEDQCTEPIKGKPANKCNTPGNRSKWCDGKSIESDYYKEYKSGHVCEYNLEITNTTLSFDAGPQISFAINGQSPGPVIECNWGDWVKIKVTNKLQNNATTIHWHGIHHKETNDMDGVPGVSECAIVPGASKVYEFRASSYGTAWYHSHLLAQYGDGIRGPMIIHGPATADYDLDMGHVMITDTFPAGTAFAQADRIAHFGQAGLATSNYLLNGNNKSPNLATGKHTLWNVQKGKKHLFRFVNGAAMEQYSVRFDNHKMTVIAADFVPIEPYETEWLNIACGQRYDVILEANQPSSNYFLRAVTQTSCPSVPVNTGLGFANGIIHYEDAVLTMPNSTHGNRTAQSFATCIDEPLAKLKPFLKKTGGDAVSFTASQKALPAGRIAQPGTNNNTVVQWFLNNQIMDINYTQPTLQTLAEQPAIVDGVSATNGTSIIRNSVVLQQKDTWYYFIVRNQFFASHPMHVHGHDVSILGQGNGEPDIASLNFVNPIRRDTMMLNGSPGPAQGGGPAGYTVIGFQSDNPGAWLMHCHIVWHVEGGMALQFIEAPKSINAGKYANKPDFKEECAAMTKYEENPANRKHVGQSGLKRGLEGLMNADVVRRDMSRHAHAHRAF
jgi:FtsP/CotA-like multicopper oxidase with cupredoxin domain